MGKGCKSRNLECTIRIGIGMQNKVRNWDAEKDRMQDRIRKVRRIRKRHGISWT